MTATTSTTEPTTESPADERFVEHPLAPGRIAIHDPAGVLLLALRKPIEKAEGTEADKRKEETGV